MVNRPVILELREHPEVYITKLLQQCNSGL